MRHGPGVAEKEMKISLNGNGRKTINKIEAVCLYESGSCARINTHTCLTKLAEHGFVALDYGIRFSGKYSCSF